MKDKFIIIPISMTILFLSCTKNITDTTGNNGKPEVILDFERKYLSEGFITDDTFRVVILSPSNAGNRDIQGIERRAKNRALASLRKYIISESINFNKYVNAQILNLINLNGRLIKKNIQHNKNDIYYFDVEKKNIKNYLKNICVKK